MPNPYHLGFFVACLATSAPATADPLPPGAVVRLGISWLGHSDSPRAVAWSPDGRTLVTLTGSSVHLWDAATGRPGHTLEIAGAKPNTAVAVAPDGRAVALTRFGESVIVVDAETGRRRPAFGRAASPRCVAFAPAGDSIAFAGRDGQLHLWDVTAGAERRTWPASAETVALAFSADGRAVLACSVTGEVATCWRWDAASGGERGEWAGLRKPIALAPDGSAFAARSADGQLTLFDGTTGRPRRAFPATNSAGPWDECVAVAPGGTLVAHAGASGSVHLWDAGTGTTRFRTEPRSLGVNALAFSPDGKRLAVAGSHRVRVLDSVTGRDTLPDGGNASNVTAIAFSPDGTAVTTQSAGMSIVWDVATGRERRRVTGSAADGVTLPNGNGLVQTLLGGLEERQPDTGRVVRALRPPDRQQPLEVWHGVAASPDGSAVAVADTAGAVHVYPPAAETPAWSAPAAAGHRPVGFADGGRSVVTFGDGVIRVFDVRTGQLQRRVPTDATAGVLSPDGTFFVTTDRRRQSSPAGEPWAWPLRVWDVITPGEPRELTTRPAYHPTVSPDGRRIAAADGNDVIVIDRDTGRERRRLRGHRHVVCLSFSPDNTRLASAGLDLTTLVWDVK